MPRIKIFLCSGIFCVYITALNAQVAPKNKTVSNVVGYQIHQQKKWNYDQIPKNSILYKSDNKYSVYTVKKTVAPLLNLDLITIPVIKKKFSSTELKLKKNSNSYIQKSHFLRYYFKDKNLLNSPLIDDWDSF